MAVWTASLVPLLPLDVLHLVGAVAQPPDLCSMLQVNKALNRTLTPILYSSIELDAWDPILVCMKTLGSPPNERSFGRTLEKHVRSLIIKRPITRKPFYASGGIGEILLKALPLMVNLKHFSSGVSLSPCSSNIFYLLATGSCPSLQSMELQVLGEIPTALEEKDPDEIESLTLQAPRNLQRLALELPVGSTAQRSFVQQLLRTWAPTLRSLSLTIDGRYVRGIWDHFLPPDVDFVHLQDLATDFQALSHPPFRRAANVRSLKVLRWGSGELSSGVLPDLHTLSCPAKQLSAFLPAEADHPRPIATVSLGKASYRSAADDTSWPTAQDPSVWRHVFAALRHLRYSAVPVTSLTVDVASIPIAGIQAAQPYLTALEYLDIVLHRAHTPDYMDMLADELVTRLPRLRTLLISHAPPTRTHGLSLDDTGLSFTESMRLSRKVILGLEDKQSMLQRLAVSADIEWRKMDDGWRWSGDPRYYRALGGSLDDPECKDELEPEFEDEDDEVTEAEGGSVYSGPSEDGTVCADSGYEDGKGVESDGYEDGGEGVDDGQEEDRGSGDDGYRSEASEDLEDTRFLPDVVSVWEELPYVD
ncbi:hypothetical protein GSI_04705 [Ganoderma sinense ZZ0214-1]|uniref:F-box domain-containing protein n=1 Tax=Ganoderma sinense ZZ0214-1 TaxID=1077348 RepID=A0A2G8SHK2_9APHY|nr:hypothetical protein GSI_04705 [Ganoderma sinense ZZ0214-1]